MRMAPTHWAAWLSPEAAPSYGKEWISLEDVKHGVEVGD